MERDKALALYPGSVAYPVGDSAALNGEILALMRAGRKTATCDAWAIFEDGTEDLPVVGRIDIALDWEGRAAMATRTLDVMAIPYDEMTQAMVLEQGEFRDLAHWRAGYKAYLTRSGSFSADVKMMFERFEVVEDFGA